MEKKKLAFRLALAAAGAAGLCVQLGIYQGTFRVSMLRMFTVLSNLAGTGWFLGAAAHQIRGGEKPFCPGWKGVCVLCLSLTGLVAATLLRGMVNFHSAMGISMFLLHVVTPTGTVLDWLIFDEKGHWGKRAPLLWLLPPYAYFGYILISARFLRGAMRFPYPFLNYEKLGAGRETLIVLGITAAYLALGTGFQRLDSRLARRKTPAGRAK